MNDTERTRSTEPYFAELTAALRASGADETHIATTVDELTGYLAETGAAPEEEFGPAAAFAAQLGGTTPAATAPAEEAQSWTWTADIYHDRRLLAAHGDQGWEVERIDSLGRFVCRRVPGAALRWEYRRETAVGPRRRAQLLERLAPEGWEACGDWSVFVYLKRPKAASEGPAAQLSELPERPARSYYFDTRTKWILVMWVLAMLALTGTWIADVSDVSAFAALGALVGSALAGAAVAVGNRRRNRS
ncbi:hypothetical protein ABT160_46330 [Streptomyces sp. NPDC001941]|uniref:hypothetical protein n=1 Tax=Streptomyces sp. NPDC001941 TaxID=3154659 RepID=UPI003320E9F1